MQAGTDAAGLCQAVHASRPHWAVASVCLRERHRESESEDERESDRVSVDVFLTLW